MDTILISAMYVALFTLDFLPRRGQRCRAANVCYLLFVLAGAALLLAVGLFPEMPKISELIVALFDRAPL